MNKKYTGRKILSLLLAAVLATSLCIPALAADAGSLSNFTKKTTYDGRFTDVKQSAYYYEGVKLCYETGILNGTSATTFSPEANITKAQLTVIAARLYNLYHGGTGEIPPYALNPSLDAGNTAYQYLVSELGDNIATIPFSETAPRWALGIFAQVLDDEALPPINHLSKVPDQIPFETAPDFEVKGMEAGVLKLYNAGVLTGSDKYGTFNNKTYITRGAVAAIVARIVDPTQRKVLNLETGKAPIVGVLNEVDFMRCENMMAFHDKNLELFTNKAYCKYEPNRWVTYYEAIHGTKLTDCSLSIMSLGSNGYEIKDLYFGDCAKKQLELLKAFLMDTTENPDEIYKKLLERDVALNTGWVEDTGYSVEGKKWISDHDGTTETIGNVLLTWSDSTYSFTIKTRAN